ncbi:Phosphatidylinositol:ceramide phosphoinositol transferase (IPC synthase) [Umbelopsis sp. WA50703]
MSPVSQLLTDRFKSIKLPSAFAGMASRKWSWFDLQYVFMALFWITDLTFIPSPAVFAWLILVIFLLAGTTVPYIRRFIIPFFPIFTWLITYFIAQFIPVDMRPQHIFVNVLPTLERILYGNSLSDLISRHTHPVLDILAWIPYGVLHFSLPFAFSFAMWMFGPPGSLDVFASAFGYMNLAGVLTQFIFPCAAPWYENKYGNAPADYTIPGEPAGLARIDSILGLNLYGASFGASPLVFGAFPSLHSGCATVQMLFLVYLRPRLWPLAFCYTLWLWWSTMYLTHHYMIDLVGGGIYAFLAFFAAYPFLPAVRPDARTRFDYLGITNVNLKSAFATLESAQPYIAQERAEREKQKRLERMEDDEEYLLGYMDKQEDFRHINEDEDANYVIMQVGDESEDDSVVNLRQRRGEDSLSIFSESSRHSNTHPRALSPPHSQRSTPRSPRSPISPTFPTAKSVEPSAQEVY